MVNSIINAVFCSTYLFFDVATVVVDLQSRIIAKPLFTVLSNRRVVQRVFTQFLFVTIYVFFFLLSIVAVVVIIIHILVYDHCYYNNSYIDCFHSRFKSVPFNYNNHQIFISLISYTIFIHLNPQKNPAGKMQTHTKKYKEKKCFPQQYRQTKKSLNEIRKNMNRTVHSNN